MKKYKQCELCGGTLQPSQENPQIGVCEYCHSPGMLFAPDDEHRTERLNRGNYYRKSGEYDRALGIYERLADEAPADAETHWCCALCRHGVEFVKDPASGRYLPTLHRTGYSSFLEDPDYLEALRYAAPTVRAHYEANGREIERIRREIIQKGQSEAPFDVFLCYKESDERGQRTVDSALAQEVYYQLTEKGYRVFFARITLENRVGEEYEPYIFAALNSARVMIVVGTRREYLQSPWVKNEWSRFLAMKKKDSKKLLLPCYRDMSPYDMPDELASLQSYNMGSIGFMQDLIRGVEKVLGDGQPTGGGAKGGSGQSGLPRLLENGQTNLRLQNYAAAEELYHQVAKEYPERHEGWWGLILCKTRQFSLLLDDVRELNTWFGYVRQLADETALSPLMTQYVAYADKLAEQDAEKEMRGVRAEIENYRKRIQNWQNKTDAKWQEQQGLQQRANLLLDSENAELANLERIEKDRNFSAFAMAMATVGTLVFLGLTLYFFGTAQIFPGFCTAAITCGLIYAIAHINLGHSTKELAEQLRSQIKARQMDDERAAEECGQDAAMQLRWISELQAFIEVCNSYLTLGKEKIQAWFFAGRCSAFGVEQERDEHIDEMHRVIESGRPGFLCPFCFAGFAYDGNDLLRGFCFCPNCGAKVELRDA